MSTPCVGYSSTSTRGAEASARAITAFCWLPPLSSLIGWSVEAATICSEPTMLAAASACRPGSTMPAGPICSTMVIVMFSAIESSGMMPRAWRSRGT